MANNPEYKAYLSDMNYNTPGGDQVDINTDIDTDLAVGNKAASSNVSADNIGAYPVDYSDYYSSSEGTDELSYSPEVGKGASSIGTAIAEAQRQQNRELVKELAKIRVAQNLPFIAKGDYKNQPSADPRVIQTNFQSGWSNWADSFREHYNSFKKSRVVDELATAQNELDKIDEQLKDSDNLSMEEFRDLRASRELALTKVESLQGDIQAKEEEIREFEQSLPYKLKKAAAIADEGTGNPFIPSDYGFGTFLKYESGEVLAGGAFDWMWQLGAALGPAIATKALAGLGLGGPWGMALGTVVGAGIGAFALVKMREHESEAEAGQAYEEKLAQEEQDFINTYGREPDEEEARAIRMNAYEGLDDLKKANMSLMSEDIAQTVILAIPWFPNISKAFGSAAMRRAFVGVGSTVCNAYTEAIEEGNQFIWQEAYKDGTLEEISDVKDYIKTYFDASIRSTNAILGLGEQELADSKEFREATRTGALMGGSFTAASSTIANFRDILSSARTKKEVEQMFDLESQAEKDTYREQILGKFMGLGKRSAKQKTSNLIYGQDRSKRFLDIMDRIKGSKLAKDYGITNEMIEDEKAAFKAGAKILKNYKSNRNLSKLSESEALAAASKMANLNKKYTQAKRDEQSRVEYLNQTEGEVRNTAEDLGKDFIDVLSTKLKLDALKEKLEAFDLAEQHDIPNVKSFAKKFRNKLNREIRNTETEYNKKLDRSDFSEKDLVTSSDPEIKQAHSDLFDATADKEIRQDEYRMLLRNTAELADRAKTIVNTDEKEKKKQEEEVEQTLGELAVEEEQKGTATMAEGLYTEEERRGTEEQRQEIERRRQEELKQSEIVKGSILVKRPRDKSEETFTGDRLKNELELLDKIIAAQIKKGKTAEEITVDLTNRGYGFYYGARASLQPAIQKIIDGEVESLSDYWNQYHPNKINAKYDAELAVLEKQGRGVEGVPESELYGQTVEEYVDNKTQEYKTTIFGETEQQQEYYTGEAAIGETTKVAPRTKAQAEQDVIDRYANYTLTNQPITTVFEASGTDMLPALHDGKTGYLTYDKDSGDTKFIDVGGNEYDIATRDSTSKPKDLGVTILGNYIFDVRTRGDGRTITIEGNEYTIPTNNRLDSIEEDNKGNPSGVTLRDSDNRSVTFKNPVLVEELSAAIATIEFARLQAMQTMKEANEDFVIVRSPETGEEYAVYYRKGRLHVKGKDNKGGYTSWVKAGIRKQVAQIYNDQLSQAMANMIQNKRFGTKIKKEKLQNELKRIGNAIRSATPKEINLTKSAAELSDVEGRVEEAPEGAAESETGNETEQGLIDDKARERAEEVLTSEEILEPVTPEESGRTFIELHEASRHLAEDTLKVYDPSQMVAYYGDEQVRGTEPDEFYNKEDRYFSTTNLKDHIIEFSIDFTYKIFWNDNTKLKEYLQSKKTFTDEEINSIIKDNLPNPKSFFNPTDQIPIKGTVKNAKGNTVAIVHSHVSSYDAFVVPSDLTKEQTEIYKENIMSKTRANRIRVLREILKGNRPSVTNLQKGRGRPITASLTKEKRNKKITDVFPVTAKEAEVAIADNSGMLHSSKGGFAEYTGNPGNVFLITEATQNGKEFPFKLNPSKLSDQHSRILLEAILTAHLKGGYNTALNIPNVENLTAGEAINILALEGIKYTKVTDPTKTDLKRKQLYVEERKLHYGESGIIDLTGKSDISEISSDDINKFVEWAKANKNYVASINKLGKTFDRSFKLGDIEVRANDTTYSEYLIDNRLVMTDAEKPIFHAPSIHYDINSISPTNSGNDTSGSVTPTNSKSEEKTSEDASKTVMSKQEPKSKSKKFYRTVDTVEKFKNIPANTELVTKHAIIEEGKEKTMFTDPVLRVDENRKIQVLTKSSAKSELQAVERESVTNEDVAKAVMEQFKSVFGGTNMGYIYTKDVSDEYNERQNKPRNAGDDPNEISPFRLRSQAPSTYKKIDIERELKWLRNKLPKENVHVVDSLIKVISSGEEAFGQTRSDMIILSRAAEYGTAFHEAFHRVSLSLLTPEQRGEMYDKARRKYDMARASNLEVEERLAERFREFVLTDNKDKFKEPSAIKRFFQELWNIIYTLFTGDVQLSSLDVENVFRAVEQGRFKYARPKKSKAAPIFKGATAYLNSQGYSSDLQRTITKNLVFKALTLNEVHRVEDVEKIDFDTVKQDVARKRDVIRDNKEYFSEQVEKASNQEEKEFAQGEIAEADRLIDLYQDILDNFEYFQSLAEDYLSSLNITRKKEDYLDNEYTSGRGQSEFEKYNKAPFQFDGRENIRSDIKMMVLTLPESKQKDAYTDMFKFVDFTSTWNKVLNDLHDVDSVEEMLERLKSKSENYFPYEVLYNRLNDHNELVRTQFLVSTRLHKNKFINAYFDDRKNKFRFRFGDAEIQSASRRYVLEWGQRLAKSDLVTKDNKIDKSKMRKYNDTYNKLVRDSVAIAKNKDENQLGKLLRSLSSLLNSINIPTDEDLLLYVLDQDDTSGRYGAAMNLLNRLKGLFERSGTLYQASLDNFPTKANGDRYDTSELFLNESIARDLGQYFAEYSPENLSSTILGPQGNAHFKYMLNSFTTDFIRKLKKDPEALQLHRSAVFNKNSYILKRISEDANARAKFKLDTFSAFVREYLDQGRSYEGMNPMEDLIARLHSTKHGKLPLPTLADRSSFYYFSGIEPVDFSFTLNNKGETIIPYDSEIIRIIEGYILDEQNRIEQTKEQIEEALKTGETTHLVEDYHYKLDNIKPRSGFVYKQIGRALYKVFKDNQGNYLGDGTKFHEFTSLNKKRAKDIKQDAMNIVVSNILDTIKLASEYGIIDTKVEGKKVTIQGNKYLDSTLVDNIAKERYGGNTNHAIKDIIATYAVNNLVSTIETDKVLLGDPAFFSTDVNKVKRSSVLGSTGENLRTDFPSGHRLANETEYNSITLDTNIVSSVYYPQLKNNYMNLLLEQGYSSVEADRLSTNKLNNYKKVDQTDAQVFISPEMYKSIKERLGEWHIEDDQALADLQGERGEFDTNPLPPLKLVYFGPSYERGMAVPTYDKMSMAVLTRDIVKDTELEELLDRMELKGDYAPGGTFNLNGDLQKIHQVKFDTATKVGNRDRFEFYADAEHEDINSLDKAAVYSQKFEFLRRQIMTDPHEETEIALGTQVKKVPMYNVNKAGIYSLQGKDVTGKEILNTINKSLGRLSTIGARKLLTGMGINPSTGVVENELKLLEVLREDAVRSNSPNNIVDALTPDANGNYPEFDSLPNRKWIENRVVSLINKNIIDLLIPGKPFIQVSNFGRRLKSTEGLDKYKDKITWLQEAKEDLKYYRIGKGGNIISMDAVVSVDLYKDAIPNYKNLTFEQKKKFLKNNPQALGYRVPTQGPNSVSSLNIVGFLPENYKDAVILPAEFTTLTGSDFDIDKLFVFRENYELDKDGNPILVPYLTDSQDKPGKVNNFEQRIYKYAREEGVAKEIEDVRKLYTREIKRILQSRELSKEELDYLQSEFRDALDRYQGVYLEAVEEDIADRKEAIDTVHSMIQDLNQGIKDVKDSIKKKSDELVEKWVKEHREEFAQRSILEQNTPAAIENILIASYRSILLDSKHAVQTYTPLDTYTDRLKKIASEVKTETELPDNYSLTPRFQADSKRRYIEGKNLIGSFALNNVHHIVGQIADLYIDTDLGIPQTKEAAELEKTPDDMLKEAFSTAYELMGEFNLNGVLPEQYQDYIKEVPATEKSRYIEKLKKTKVNGIPANKLIEAAKLPNALQTTPIPYKDIASYKSIIDSYNSKVLDKWVSMKMPLPDVTFEEAHWISNNEETVNKIIEASTKEVGGGIKIEEGLQETAMSMLYDSDAIETIDTEQTTLFDVEIPGESVLRGTLEGEEASYKFDFYRFVKDYISGERTVKVSLSKIISGGQTGADQGGLVAALNLGIETGGTAPQGFITEKGKDESLSSKYGLVEGEYDPKIYPKRTRKNIENSDGTLLVGNTTSPGTKLTVNLAKKLNKPYIVNPSSRELAKWIADNNIKVLNVAGNRESVKPGIQKQTADLIEKALQEGYKVGQKFTPTNTTNVAGTDIKPSVTMPMNFKDGQGGRKMRPEFRGKSTMDLIISGDRTATSRSPEARKHVKKGDVVKFTDTEGRSVLVRATTDEYSLDKITPEEWSKVEGWSEEEYSRLEGKGYVQFQYEKITKIEKTTTGTTNLAVHKGVDGEYVSDWMSAAISALVDIGKDPYIFDVNVNNTTQNVANLLLRSGLGDRTFYFLAQPILKDLAYYDSLTDKSGSGIAAINTAAVSVVRGIYKKRMKEEFEKLKKQGVEKFETESTGKPFNFTRLRKDASGKHANDFEYYARQLEILGKYQELKGYGAALTEAVMASRIDTAQYGKNLVEARIYENKYNKVLRDNVIKNFKKSFTDTFLGEYMNNVLPALHTILKNRTITSTDGFDYIHNQVLKFTGTMYTSDNRLMKDVVNYSANEIYSAIVSRFFSDPEYMGYDSASVNKLLKGNNSVARRVYNVKFSPNKYQDLKKNKLLDMLSPRLAENESDYDKLATNTIDIAEKWDKDEVTKGWKELLSYPNDAVRRLGKDLVAYAFFTSGFNGTLNSFFEYIPFQYLRDVGFSDYISWQIQDLNHEENFSSIAAEVLDEFFKHSWFNDNIVPEVQDAALYNTVGWGNRESALITVDSEKNELWVGSNSHGTPVYKPFIKRLWGDEVYLYEYIGYNAVKDPVYRLTDRRGYSSRGHKVKEYGLKDTLFEENKANLASSKDKPRNTLFDANGIRSISKSGKKIYEDFTEVSKADNLAVFYSKESLQDTITPEEDVDKTAKSMGAKGESLTTKKLPKGKADHTVSTIQKAFPNLNEEEATLLKSMISSGEVTDAYDKNQYKAPNDNISNLFSELESTYDFNTALRTYLHTRTSEFKEWFGDWVNDPKNSSKAVDVNGEPEVLWHGSTEQFSGTSDKAAFYATPNINFARRYGKSSAERTGVSEENIQTRPLFLNMRNPRKFSSEEVEYDTVANIGTEDVKTWKAWGNDGIIYIEEQAFTSDGTYEEYVTFDSDNIYFVDDYGRTNRLQESEITTEAAMSLSSMIEEYNQNIEIYEEAIRRIKSDYGAGMMVPSEAFAALPEIAEILRSYDYSSLGMYFEGNRKLATYDVDDLIEDLQDGKISQDYFTRMTGLTPVDPIAKIAKKEYSNAISLLESRIRYYRNQVDKLVAETEDRISQLNSIQIRDTIFDGKIEDTHVPKVVKKLRDNYDTFFHSNKYRVWLDLIEKTDAVITTQFDSEGHSNAYMYYDPNKNTIHISMERLDSSMFSYFGVSMIHEGMHSLTVRSLLEPTTKTEREFHDKIRRYWQEALRRLPNSKSYGLKNPLEFVSEIIANPNFVRELQTTSPSLWDKIVALFTDLFRAISGKKLVNSATEEILTFSEYIINRRLDRTITVEDLPSSEQRAPRVKEGVDAVFQQNPDLANKVYEALGFKSEPDVILPIGTSGSGKSTFIKSLPQENLVVIEPDAMRVEFTGDINDKSKDKEIYEEAAKRAVAAIKQGKQVVFDTTNLTKDKRLPFIEAIKKEIPTANVQYKLMDLNPELAKQRIKAQIARGENRANVPDSTIDRHAESYKQMLEDIKSESISNFEVTPQQKQQALEAYSQYLNTIFSSSTTREIYQHSSSHPNMKEVGFEKGHGRTSDAFFFDKVGKEPYVGKSIVYALLDIKNPFSYKDLRAVKNFIDSKYGEGTVSDIEKGMDIERRGYIDNISNEKAKQNYLGLLDIYDPNTGGGQFIKNKQIGELEKYGNFDSIIAEGYPAVFNPDQIHILGSEQDIQGFREFDKNEPSYEQRAGRVRIQPQDKRFFTRKSVEDHLIAQDGIAGKRYQDKIWVKADSEGSNNYAKALKLVNAINSNNPGLLKLLKKQDASRQAGRDVYTVEIDNFALKRNQQEIDEMRRQANEDLISLDQYEQRYDLKDVVMEPSEENKESLEHILRISSGESIQYKVSDGEGKIGDVLLEREGNNLRVRWIKFDRRRGEGLAKKVYRKLNSIALKNNGNLISDKKQRLNIVTRNIWESLVNNSEAETTQEGSYRMTVNTNDLGTDILDKENRADFERKKDIMLNTFPYVQDVAEDYSIEQKGLLEQNGRVIRVNPNKWTTDTIGHEFGHLLIDLMGGLENPLVKKALKELEGSSIEQEVYNTYSDLVGVDDITLKKEVLATAIGRDTADIFNNIKDNEQRLQKASRWERVLMRIFDRIKQLLHIEKSAVRKLAKKVVSQKPTEAAEETLVDSYEQRVDRELTAEEKKNIAMIRGIVSAQGAIDSNITRADKLKDKVLERLETKISLYKNRGKREQVAKLSEEYEKMKEDSPIVALARFASVAGKHTKHIYDRYWSLKDRIDKGEVTNKELAELFRQWYDYLVAFDTLEEMKEEYLKFTKQSEIQEQFSGIRDFLTSTIEMKNSIKSLYTRDSSEILVNALSEFDTRAYEEFKLEKEKEWRQWSKEDKKAKPLAQFLDEEVKQNEDLIKQNIRNSLRNEIEKAKYDIPFLARWADSVLDSNDEVVASAVKAFMIQHNKSRDESIDVRDEVVELTRELEKKQGYTTISSPESLYDFMLEKTQSFIISGDVAFRVGRTIYISEKGANNFKEAVVTKSEDYGNWVRYTSGGKEFLLEPNLYEYKSHNSKYTQHYVSEFHSEFHSQLDLIKEIAFGRDYSGVNPKKAARARGKEINRWKNNNTNFDTNKYRKDKALFYDTLVEQGILSEETKTELIDNDYSPGDFKRDITDILEDNETAISEILKWIRENEWEYRTPIDMWKNPEWEKLTNIKSKNPDDPRVKYYEYIVNKNAEIDMRLPYKYRLGTRLPGVSKTFVERLRSGYNIGKALKGTGRKAFTRRPEDIQKGETVGTGKTEKQRSEILKLQDENGNERMFLPIFYSSNINESEQSYDLASLYNMRFTMGIDYKYKSEILPFMELTQFHLNNRKLRLVAKGNPIKNALRSLRGKEVTKEKGSYIAEQFEDWMKHAMYGKSMEQMGEFSVFGQSVDTTKVIQNINKYSAYNLLGLNLVQGIANWGLGQVMQRVEAFAGEYTNMKDYERAGIIFKTNLPGIFNDIGSRAPTNKLSRLEEWWDILHDYGNDPRMRKHNKFRQLMTSNLAFFQSHMGEYMMQVRFAVSMALSQKIYDKDGNIMKRSNGRDMTLYHAIEVDKETGKIKLNDRVEKESDWTRDEALQFGNKIKRVLSRMHGEYSKEGSNAIQRHALGQAGMMFRKFVVPGFKRRWEHSRLKDENGNYKFKYNELLESSVEGAYISFLRIMPKIIWDLMRFKADMARAHWKGVTAVERANIRRTLGDHIFLAAFIIIGWAALKGLKEADDDREEYMYQTIAFHALRLRSELLFFYSPGEFQRILRSPAASLAIIENLINFFSEFADPGQSIFDEIEKGPLKGNPRYAKHLNNMLPFWKQYYRLTDMGSMLAWFR